jgi:hypothetical protein
VLGIKTKKGTVNAVREVGQRLERLRALAKLGEMADRGDFDEFLGNKAAYRCEPGPVPTIALAQVSEELLQVRDH